jgi:beta-galactosidase
MPIPATDLIALNKYPGWYEGPPSSMNSLLDNFHAFTPQPIGVSEYGAGASILQHEQGLTRAPKAAGKWHPEEWQATVHEGAWAAIAKRPFVWGSFIWNMFDFASVGRNEGDSPQLNDKGLVTRDRKVRKDAFFFYNAFWSPEPVLYITSRRAAIRVRPETQLPSSHLP